MGKETGFLEYERHDRGYLDPKERLTNYKEFVVPLADKELQDKLAQIGFQVWPSKTPEEFTQYVAGQLTHWRTLIQQAGIQPE